MLINLIHLQLNLLHNLRLFVLSKGIILSCLPSFSSGNIGNLDLSTLESDEQLLYSNLGKINTEKNCTEEILQKIQAEVRNCVSDIINNIDNEESTIIPCKQLGEIPEKCIRMQSVSCFSAREIDFKYKFSSEILLELRNIVEM